MKVFIVAKMRATLQKQHRDTTVTQPGARRLSKFKSYSYCSPFSQTFAFSMKLNRNPLTV